ncbi:hypothetical protein RvY_16440 [Ramazzottius varieornatus]|uniref:Uncharacterized protein n=1 Tax=Ramazzottius varieornatus TaxID=947166 RepID=A0A1D1W609_RAMVA|nr:hypothetical protein RvY_16440 [Ramazzottius varieornatus]
MSDCYPEESRNSTTYGSTTGLTIVTEICETNACNANTVPMQSPIKKEPAPGYYKCFACLSDNEPLIREGGVIEGGSRYPNVDNPVVSQQCVKDEKWMGPSHCTTIYYSDPSGEQWSKTVCYCKGESCNEDPIAEGLRVATLMSTDTPSDRYPLPTGDYVPYNQLKYPKI